MLTHSEVMQSLREVFNDLKAKQPEQPLKFYANRVSLYAREQLENPTFPMLDVQVFWNMDDDTPVGIIVVSIVDQDNNNATNYLL